MIKPCEQCPWRIANQGKAHPFRFYTKANLRRLWNQIRKGGAPQSCHLTDPSHPDHIAVGAKSTAKVQECPGSIVIIRREFRKMADVYGKITDEGLKRYEATRKKGLSKSGLIYWLVARLKFGGVPIIGGPKIPDVDETDQAIGLPGWLQD